MAPTYASENVGVCSYSSVSDTHFLMLIGDKKPAPPHLPLRPAVVEVECRRMGFLQPLFLTGCTGSLTTGLWPAHQGGIGCAKTNKDGKSCDGGMGLAIVRVGMEPEILPFGPCLLCQAENSHSQTHFLQQILIAGVLDPRIGHRKQKTKQTLRAQGLCPIQLVCCHPEAALQTSGYCFLS